MSGSHCSIIFVSFYTIPVMYCIAHQLCLPHLLQYIYSSYTYGQMKSLDCRVIVETCKALKDYTYNIFKIFPKLMPSFYSTKVYALVSGEEQDAHEFYSYFMECLEEVERYIEINKNFLKCCYPILF